VDECSKLPDIQKSICRQKRDSLAQVVTKKLRDVK